MRDFLVPVAFIVTVVLATFVLCAVADAHRQEPMRVQISK